MIKYFGLNYVCSVWMDFVVSRNLLKVCKKFCVYACKIFFSEVLSSLLSLDSQGHP